MEVAHVAAGQEGPSAGGEPGEASVGLLVLEGQPPREQPHRPSGGIIIPAPCRPPHLFRAGNGRSLPSQQHQQLSLLSRASSSSPEALWSLDPMTSPLPAENLNNQLEEEDPATEEEERQENLTEEEEVDEDDDGEEDDNLTMEEATRKTVMDNLQDGDMTVAEQIRFLRAIPPMCFHTQKTGRNILEPPGSKAAVAQKIAELLEELPLDSGPSSILSCCLVAVGNLSKLQPALERELESRLLQAALSRIFPMDMDKDHNIQSLHKSLEEKLDVMLRSLLAVSPSMDNLQHTLELEDVLARIWHQLFSLRTLKQVPEVFKSFDNMGSP